MKSEKAKKYIDNDAIVMRNGDRMVDASTAYMAMELAEGESEDRMRRKAIRAFCENECGGTCEIADKCETLKCFIQKMDEE